MNLCKILDCANYLESDKVNERRRYCTKLCELLENENEVKLLKTNGNWKRLIHSLQTCLRKDADKAVEEKTKKSVNIAVTIAQYKAAELLVQVVNLALTEGIDIKITELLGYILGCMKDSKMKMCYEKTLLILLQKAILLRPKSMGQLQKEDWSEMYNLLKKLVEQKVDSVVADCFMLLIKWGPINGLCPKLLREDFDFMTKFCQKVILSSPRFLQENTLEVALNFCEHNAKDNRISCCKFGEDVIMYFTHIYERNGKPEKSKELLIEFLLLQMIIHHPKGMSENPNSDYIHNSDTWKIILKSMYRLLTEEINLYIRSKQKNTSFFKEEGGKVKLCENFSKLFVETSRQLFKYPDLEITLSHETVSPPEKRRKTEFIFTNYIDCIQRTKNWLWVHLVGSLIKTYPNLVGIEEYVSLLQILSSIQIESNEFNLIDHLYDCLSIMLSVEKFLDTSSHQDEIKKVWKLIGASTARAFGLNQHKDATEKLLQQLISRGIIDFEDLLQTYQSGLISLSLQTIKTFDSGLRFMILNDLQKKERIMKCLLQSQTVREYKYLCNKETAKFLVKLTFKQYKSEQTDDDFETKKCKYDVLKEIYSKTLLDEDISLKKNDEPEVLPKNPDLDKESEILLNRVVRDFVNTTDTEEIRFSKITLLVNISSCLIEYNIISEEEINSSPYMELLESSLNASKIKLESLFAFKNERDVRRLIQFMNIIKVLFSLKVSKPVMDKLKELIPLELINSVFRVLNKLQEDQKIMLQLSSALKIAMTEALSNFACFCGNGLNANQIKALELLAQPNYNCIAEDDYILLTTFLKTLKLVEPGIFPNSILTKILACTQNLAAVRYHDKAEDILDILCGLYPHVLASDNENKFVSICFLKPFHEMVPNAGPNVSLLVLECLQVLCKLDPQNNISRWSDDEVIKFVPAFLKSHYLEVRLKAIDVLVTYYVTNSTSNDISDIHRQEEIFMKICEMSLAVFEVSGKISGERRVDEVLTRAASVSLTFINIATSCDNWLEESLYNLMKIAHVRGIELDNAFKIINRRKFGAKNSSILEKYIHFMIEKWLNDKYTFDNFHYGLFDCTSKYEFFKKYFDQCAHLIMKEEGDLKEISEGLGLTEQEIVEKTSAKIFASSICNDLENVSTDILNRNKLLTHFSKVVGIARLKEILKENLDQIVIGILDFLTDENYIKDALGESVIFFTKYLNVPEIECSFNFIEALLLDEQLLGRVLTDDELRKLENILLKLKLEFFAATVLKDQLKCFHRYTFFISFITKFLTPDRNWRVYFIRDVVHTLLNVIENNENCKSILSASSRFLGTFLVKILPNLAATFKLFLPDTINSLKKFYITRKIIACDCKVLLNFLIVTNLNAFKEEIPKLDTFPDIDDFKEIKSVQKTVRYGDREPQLEEEIIQFLKHEDMMSKEDSLVNLRKLLASQKDKLLAMYDKFREIKFSEDCEDSMLHKLVCALSQLSYSPNQKVSFEAARCLGELGPANLQTLVLQPEKILVHGTYSPYEILVGTVISVLSVYIIDSDVDVVKKASKMLYTVLNSEEGKKMSDAKDDFGFGIINKTYLTPYIPRISKLPTRKPSVNVQLFLTKLQDDNIWCPDGNIGHNKWITRLVSTLLDTFADKSFLQEFVEVCEVKVDFSECLFPLIIHLLLFFNNKTISDLVSVKLDYFFSKHWNYSHEDARKTDSIVLNKKSVKSMLNVVNYVRLMKTDSYKFKCKGELTVNYLKVAKASEFCANHFAALYYSELWCQQTVEKIQDKNPSYSEKRITMIDDIYENHDSDFENLDDSSENVQSGFGETLHNILKNAYKSIGDFDALPGCGKSFLLQPKYRVEHYKELGKFDQVIQFYANEDSNILSKELINSFKNYSMYQIPIICSSPEEPDYECLWRLGQWSFEKKKMPLSNDVINYDNFEKYRFSSLKALHDKNMSSFQESLRNQFLCVTNYLKNVSLESSHNLYPVLSKLQSLTEIEDFSNSSKLKNVASLIEKWKLQDKLIRKSDFQVVEPIISQRLVMLSDYLNTKNELNSVRDYIVDLSLTFAGWAKDEGLSREGSKILSNLKNIPSLNEETMAKIDLLDAQLCWSVNNTEVAMQLLNRTSKNKDIPVKLVSSALKLTGLYMSETRSENSTTIISAYFLRSVKMMQSVNRTEEDIQNIMDTYDKLALFAHHRYQQIRAYMESDSFQRKVINMEQAKKTAASLQKQKNRTNDERKAAAIHDRNSNIDDAEIRNAKLESNQFLKLALKYYLLSLVHSDHNNLRVFQIISLFLENRKTCTDEIVKTIEEHLHKVPSYKFVITLPQLIPHLADKTEADIFSSKVNEIVEHCALQHPHHTLPLLLSLANAYRDREFDSSKTKTLTNDTRVATVKHFIATLRKKQMADFINKLDQVSLALIDLAYYKSPDESNDRKKEFSIPRDHKIMRVRDFNEVLVPTVELPLSVTQNYSNIVGISSFEKSYEIVGGVNKPKKILCRGTDGKNYSQLVKGQDDLRQDAVMQQVFTIMNNLLLTSKSTKHLRIRTYKIVPLSMRSGILKWADNSMPIGEYLVGTKETRGAHQMYRPNDITPNVCRDMFKGCANRTADVKLRTYKDICKKFKPVFHHFFEYQFPQPAVWYERRRAYIQSVATTSMCGYILGIGDRHTSNILIDKTTAEVIHIDFGIAFEQGRVLPTPETVPFRLTRDMVDGMGVSGVEGVFRRSCEKTVKVLRQNAQTIRTILEVLLYDPLYAWTVTSAEANKRQTESDDSGPAEGSDSSQESTNISAERALLRLQEKLQGTELGYPSSIEHQVGNLIQQAVDPENLCKLYVGWQPYL